MKINRVLFTVIISFFATILVVVNTQAAERKYHAVIIQGAGYPPDGEQPAEGSDAVTAATTKEINTYTLTTALTAKLIARDVDVTVVQHTECKGLKSLRDGSQRVPDLIIFAGPSHFSKQPVQLTKLYPKLKAVVKNNPNLICSTLIPAWYPETKGRDSIKFAAKAFEKNGAGVVEGLSILTPRDKKKGAPAKEVEQMLTDFAERLGSALGGK